MSSLTSVGESLVISLQVVASEWNVRSGMSKLLSEGFKRGIRYYKCKVTKHKQLVSYVNEALKIFDYEKPAASVPYFLAFFLICRQLYLT